ncbi:hypothetical protein Drorol1_Dr00026894 [Drosera rotundifolia]
MIDEPENHIFARYRFFFYDQKRDKYVTIQDQREKQFHASKREWGISRALRLNVFNDASNGLLVDGSCELGVEIDVLKCENKAMALSIEEDETVCSYVWEIENFSKKLILHPKGNGSGTDKFITLFWAPHDESFDADGRQLYADFELCLRNHLESGNGIKRTSVWFCEACLSFGSKEFVSISDVCDPLKGFLANDALTVEVILHNCHGWFMMLWQMMQVFAGNEETLLDCQGRQLSGLLGPE